MMEALTVRKALSRIAGDALFYAISSGGVVKKAFFIPIAPLRGFETLVRGKSPLFAVEAVKRICGLCHSSHGIAAVEAFENALGIYPPKDGLLAREAIGLLNKVQSHILHAVLIAPDLLRPELVPKAVVELMRLLEQVNSALTKIGGSPIHPPYITVGGVLKLPTEAVITSSRQALKDLRRGFEELARVFTDEANWSPKAFALARKDVNVEKLATHPTYGDRHVINVENVRLVPYYEFRKAPETPEEAKHATAMVALYGDSLVEVGPRARMVKFYGFKESKGLLSIQLARLQEVIMSIERLELLLSEMNPRAPPRVEGVTFRRGVGVGVYEAPRGTLIHQVELDTEGRVRKYRIVVPTEFLVPVMEEASVGVEAFAAEAVPRVFDPCIPCATHVVEVSK